MSRPYRIATLMLAPLLLAAASGPVVVNQVGRAFSVRELHVKRGETVRFNNADEFLHQIYVRATTFNFASSEQEPGGYVDIRFTALGSFDVRCEIHPRMLLKVSVE
jgi:plastocyanin